MRNSYRRQLDLAAVAVVAILVVVLLHVARGAGTPRSVDARPPGPGVGGGAPNTPATPVGGIGGVGLASAAPFPAPVSAASRGGSPGPLVGSPANDSATRSSGTTGVAPTVLSPIEPSSGPDSDPSDGTGLAPLPRIGAHS